MRSCVWTLKYHSLCKEGGRCSSPPEHSPHGRHGCLHTLMPSTFPTMLWGRSCFIPILQRHRGVNQLARGYRANKRQGWIWTQGSLLKNLLFIPLLSLLPWGLSAAEESPRLIKWKKARDSVFYRLIECVCINHMLHSLCFICNWMYKYICACRHKHIHVSLYMHGIFWKPPQEIY